MQLLAPAPQRVRPPPQDVPEPLPARGRTVSALSAVDRLTHIALGLLWLAVVAQFWRWWLPHHDSGTPWLFYATSAALAYHTTVLPTVFWYFAGRMRRPRHRLAPQDLRVAMITLCVPAQESLSVIRRQLRALAEVDLPHTSWVLDEGGSPEVKALAAEFGVRYFSRRGVARYNQPGAPFQAKTKAGNVNSWLDHVEALGLEYDVFVQLDIDHRPTPQYLDRVLGHFRDPDVAWVQAPSVCGNLGSWTARGLAEQELVFQGPLQMGFFGSSRTPFIIGSHTSYRTSAIREIGGFQPTRAEDHLDTVVLAANGYHGVFVPETIAVGDGPEDFATYLRQQFAWAHSMIGIFLTRTPRLIWRYSPAQALQFVFSQSWYTLWSASLAFLWLVPAIALWSGDAVASVTLGRYLQFSLPMVLVAGLMWCWSRRWFQPKGVRMSWRGIVLELARWPVVLWAFVNVVFRVKRGYMITPKGMSGGDGPRAISIYGPYLGLAMFSLLSVILSSALGRPHVTSGYAVLALFNALLATAVVVIVLTLELRQRAKERDVGNPIAGRRLITGGVGLLMTAFALAMTDLWPTINSVFAAGS